MYSVFDVSLKITEITFWEQLVIIISTDSLSFSWTWDFSILSFQINIADANMHIVSGLLQIKIFTMDDVNSSVLTSMLFSWSY